MTEELRLAVDRGWPGPACKPLPDVMIDRVLGEIDDAPAPERFENLARRLIWRARRGEAKVRQHLGERPDAAELEVELQRLEPLPHRYLTVFGQHDALAGHFRDPELGELGVEVFLGLASVSLAGALPDLMSSEAHGDPPHLAPLER